MGKLNVLRNKIDNVDSHILKLLNQRAEIALEVGNEKSKSGISNFHIPHREREIFNRLKELNTGPFSDKAILSVYREVLSATLSLEKPLSIAYMGPQATFSHVAGLKEFGKSAVFLPCKNIEDVFAAVEKNTAHYGIVPVENSTEGAINHTLDMLVQTKLKVAAEIFLRVSQHLLSLSKEIKKIKKIYSHPQPAAQCRNWLRENLPGVKIQEVSSTARASELAARYPDTASIAGDAASQLYKLNILKNNIEDSSDNVTRFLVMGNEIPLKSGNDKTSLIFGIRDRPGELFRTLNYFAKNNINMTRIESRPLKDKKWKYLFFVDIEGYYKNIEVKRTIKAIEKSILYFKILGSYPAGEEL